MANEIKIVPTEVSFVYKNMDILITNHKEKIQGFKSLPIDDGYLYGTESTQMYKNLKDVYDEFWLMSNVTIELLEATKRFLEKTYKDATNADLAAAVYMDEDL